MDVFQPAVITEATTEPVSMAEAKAHCRIDGSAGDASLTLMIGAARRYLEDRTNRTFHQKTLEWYPAEWPDTNRIRLPRATPLVSITSVKYYSASGAETTWGSSNYLADTYSTPGAIVLADGVSWPSGAQYPVAPIRIRYVAGIATASPVTEADSAIKHAMLLLLGGMWEYRESELMQQTNAMQLLAAKYGAEAFIQRLTVHLT